MLSAAKLSILCILAIILGKEATPIHASVRRYKFELIRSPHTRLCTNKTMLTINGQFPGPTIYARRGDLVIVDVINRADQIITLHWHGVKMPRYPWNDGPIYVTQCPIRPGGRFTQRIVLSDEEGTLWWHAHSEWSRNSVHGALVILPPRNNTYPFPKPHAQAQILIGEWWNADIQRVYEQFQLSYNDHQASDAFLINGQPGDFYPCSTQDIYRLKVESGKTYLIRMVNTAMNHLQYFGIANHTITVVGADGSYTKPSRSDYISIAPGQTMGYFLVGGGNLIEITRQTIDFLLEANQPPSRYYMAARVKSVGTDQFYGTQTPATGYLEYAGNYPPPPSPPFPSLPLPNDTVSAHNFFAQLRSLNNATAAAVGGGVPQNVTENLFYTLAVNLRPCPNASCAGPFGERVLASVNNLTLVYPETGISFLDAYYYNISGVYDTDFPDNPPKRFNYTQADLPKFEISATVDATAVRMLEYGSTVEVVFQGTNLPIGMDHPMHLHGYSFYVVGSGFGNFDPDSDPVNYNLVDPPLVETVVVPSSGWTAVRFKANNPGVWYMHCHFEHHNTWGMAMVFIVKDGKRPHEKMLPPPPDMPPCQDPAFTLRNSNSLEPTVKDDAF